ncbi:MAG: PKD domain-containing protein [Methanoregula sp.]|nr:MAG: PKD domain-containing protein [Methanoregula sp.]
MRKKAEFWFLVVGLVVLSAIFAGCSGETSPATPVPTTTAVGPKFVAGDIIAKTASSTDSIWLIVKYDAKADKYERAFVYKKSDGSWYRKDERTELADRATTEKLYPAKVTHVSSISAVPIVTATTVPVTTSTTVTATTAPLAAPTVTGITPSSGSAGSTLNITGIVGTNFRSGATVRLERGAASIAGSSVTIVSSSNITCQFIIPSSAATGAWNVTVINTDGQSESLASGFSITNTTTTPPLPVIANFTSNPTSGNKPLAVQFTDASTGPVTSMSWTFGDGNTSTTQNPLYTYPNAGTFTVSLMVSNGSGSNTQTRTNYITVTTLTPAPVTASFTGNPTSGNKPLAVQFTDVSTGPVTSWLWIFGDGNTSIIQGPLYTYPDAGTYTVSLTVSNGTGTNTQTRANYITVMTPPPVASFTGIPTSGTAPITVAFTDTSTNSPTSWAWNFGDAETSSIQNPSHQYTSAGNYTVTLTATNAVGSNTATMSNYITVT